jgi:PPP family 3-phenylpropionic acid transporter
MNYHKGFAAGDGFALRMAAFYAAFFAFAGIQLPYLPVWLEAKGLDSRQIGFALAAAMGARPLIVPFATRVADRYGVLKGPLVLAGFAAIGLFALVGASEGFLAILLTFGLASLAQTVMLPFADAYALRGLAERQRTYGSVRLWGSVTFIAANFAGGMLLEAFGAGNLIWALVAAMAVTAASAAALRPLGAAPREEKEAPATTAPLWRSKTFIAVVAAASLIQSSHAVLHGFATLQWTALGLQGPTIGALWAIGVVAEIALFAVSGRVLLVLRPLELIAFGAAGAFVRWTAMAFDPPAMALPALQCLHALSFGATHIGSMQVLARLAGERRGATAQGDYATVVGLVFAVAMSFTGVLVQALGAYAYLAMSAAALLGGVTALAARRYWPDAAPT